MIVERIWTGNAYRNYNYLIVCPESGEALPSIPWTTRNAWRPQRTRVGRSRKSSILTSITTTLAVMRPSSRRPAPR